jgi:short-subunit dehydrogenase
MLNAYTHNAESAGYSPEKIRAIAIDLLKDNKTEATQEDIERLGGKFDVIVVCAAFPCYSPSEPYPQRSM